MKYQATQRMLCVICGERDVSKLFLELTADHVVCATTRAGYWTTLQTASRALGLPPIADASKTATFLEKLAIQHIPLRPSCLLEEVMEWASGLEYRLGTAILLAFQIAHRISDCLQLQEIDATLSNIGSVPSWLITVRRGKTVVHTGAYTIALPLDSIAGQRLTVLSQQIPRQTWLFLGENTLADCQEQIRQEIGRDVRCLRRGGLQAIARSGATVEQLLQFSRHADEPMLRRYLHEGRDLVSVHNHTLTLISTVERHAFPWK
jgi:hypothetical protein